MTKYIKLCKLSLVRDGWFAHTGLDVMDWLRDAEETKGISSIAHGYMMLGDSETYTLELTDEERALLTTRGVEVFELLCGRLYSEMIECAELSRDVLAVNEDEYYEKFS